MKNQHTTMMRQKLSSMEGSSDETKGLFLEFQEEMTEGSYEAMKSSIYGHYHTNHCQRQPQFGLQTTSMQYENLCQSKVIRNNDQATNANNHTNQNAHHTNHSGHHTNHSSHLNNHHNGHTNLQSLSNALSCSSRTVYPHYSSCMASQLFHPASNRDRR